MGAFLKTPRFGVCSFASEVLNDPTMMSKGWNDPHFLLSRIAVLSQLERKWQIARPKAHLSTRSIDSVPAEHDGV